MRKKLFSIIIFMILILPFYVKADTGNISISCPSGVKSGESVKCTIKGSSANEISGVESTINLSDNLEVVSFTLSDNWQGDDVSDGKISVYRDETVKDEFTIGYLMIRAKSGVYDRQEKIYFTNTMFSHDANEYEISDAGCNIGILNNNANLSSIKVNGDGKFFDKNKTSFNIEVNSDVVNIVVETEDGRATVTGDGSKVLNYGDNKYTIIVTAEDGTKKEYVLNITRVGGTSNNNNNNKDNNSNNNIDNDEMPPQTGNVSIIIAIVLLVISLGVGIYFYQKRKDIK